MKKHSNNRAFYSVIMTMNAMVGAVLFVLNIPPPPPLDTTPIVVHTPPKPKTIPAIVGTPTRLVIPSLGVNLQVATGTYDVKAGDWTSSLTKALYADSSMPANDSNGTTLIYGHAQAAIFENLPALQPGAKARVYTDTNHIFRYTYRSSKQVIPTDMSIFTVHGSPKLVLQTCSGAWDTYRSLYSFKLDMES